MPDPRLEAIEAAIALGKADAPVEDALAAIERAGTKEQRAQANIEWRNAVLARVRLRQAADAAAQRADQAERAAGVRQPGIWQALGAAMGAAANGGAQRGGVDFLGGNLWIQRAGAGRPAPNPPAAQPQRQVANAGAVPGGGAAVLPDWCAIDALDQAKACKAALPAAAAGGLCAAVGLRMVDGRLTIPEWAGNLTAMPLGIGSAILRLIYIPCRLVDKVVPYIPFPKTCDIVRGSVMLLWGAAINWANALTKGALTPLARSVELQRNFGCPYETIDPETAIALRLRGIFSQDQAVDWGKVASWCDWKTLWHIAAEQQWYTVEMGWQLYLRGDIATTEALKIWWRQCGLLDNNVADKEIATRWQLLDRGSIIDALHRLRPGRDPSGVTYTETEARTDLRALGYRDRSIDIIIALSRHPPNFRQLQRPFVDGKVSLSDIQEFQRDDGLSEAGISALAPFLEHERTINQREIAGAPKPPALAKGVADGSISAAEYSAEMHAQGYPTSVIASGLAEATAERARSLRAQGIAAARARLRSGESTVAQTETELLATGVGADEAREITQLWVLERATGSKPASVGDLCQWTTQGLLSVGEYQQRLIALGYSRADADRIIDVCGLKARAQRERQLVRNASKAAQEMQRRAKKLVSDMRAGAAEVRGAQAQTEQLIGRLKGVAGSVKGRAKKDQSVPPDVARDALSPSTPSDTGTAPGGST